MIHLQNPSGDSTIINLLPHLTLLRPDISYRLLEVTYQIFDSLFILIDIGLEWSTSIHNKSGQILVCCWWIILNPTITALGSIHNLMNRQGLLQVLRSR